MANTIDLSQYLVIDFDQFWADTAWNPQERFYVPMTVGETIVVKTSIPGFEIRPSVGKNVCYVAKKISKNTYLVTARVARDKQNPIAIWKTGGPLSKNMFAYIKIKD